MTEDYCVERRDGILFEDICHRLRTNRLTLPAGYWNTKLCYKVRNGGLIWNISRFQHKK
jgi:hypothetical protein